jgi:hypothetical protein
MQQYAPARVIHHSGTLLSKFNAQELASHSTDATYTILTDSGDLVIEAGIRIQSSQEHSPSAARRGSIWERLHLMLLCSVKLSLC